MDEIKAELRVIEKAIGDNTKAVQRSRLNTRLQWGMIALVLGFFGWVLVDDHSDDRREDKARLAQEEREADAREEEAKQDCLDGIESREDNRQRLLEIAREINSQRLTDIINSSYEGSPPPVDCD